LVRRIDGDNDPAVACGRLEGRPAVTGRVEEIDSDSIRRHRVDDLRHDPPAEDGCLSPAIAKGDAFPLKRLKLGSLVLNQSRGRDQEPSWHVKSLAPITVIVTVA
jgi:hypothetical protein